MFTLTLVMISMAVFTNGHIIDYRDDPADACTCHCTNSLQMMNLRPEIDEEAAMHNNALIAKFLALQDVPPELQLDWIFIESEIRDESGIPEKDLFSDVYGVSRFGDPNYPWTDILVDSNIALWNVPLVEEIPEPYDVLYHQEVDKDSLIQDFSLFWYKTHWWGIFSVGMNWRNKTLEGKYKNELFVRDPGCYGSFMNTTSRRGLGYKHDRSGGSTDPHIATQFYHLPKQRFYASEYAHNEAVHNCNLLGNQVMLEGLDLVEIYSGKEKAVLVPKEEYQQNQEYYDSLRREVQEKDKQLEEANAKLKEKDAENQRLRQELEKLKMQQNKQDL